MTAPNLSLILIMICFWLTTWLVYRFLIVPVGAVLGERQRRIDDAANRWQSTHDEYLEATARLEQELESAAREAARLRAEHRQQALAERQETLETARAAADERLHQALAELDTEAGSARDELRARAQEFARLFASRLLDREVAS
jgi:F0F1-type ATP synthase membrane subunit b/b'